MEFMRRHYGAGSEGEDDDSEDEGSEYTPENKGAARPRHGRESKEDKRARKEAVKLERQVPPTERGATARARPPPGLCTAPPRRAASALLTPRAALGQLSRRSKKQLRGAYRKEELAQAKQSNGQGARLGVSVIRMA
jgi:hypothetical protein